MEKTSPENIMEQQEECVICPHCGNEDEFFIHESSNVIYCLCGLGIMTA